MIALLLALAASPQASVKPLLFDCDVSDQDGSRHSVAILARGAALDEDKWYDPSDLLAGGEVNGTTDAWPFYWEHDVAPYFGRGVHRENLGTWGGWTARVEPVNGSKRKATITINNFDSKLISNERPSAPDFVLKGNCTWREGRGALATYRRLSK